MEAVAEGIRPGLMEEVKYDESGQAITGSFRDYALPRAEDIPTMDVGGYPSTAEIQSARHQGCAKKAAPGSPSSACNAVMDALSGIRHSSTSTCRLTPETGLARDPGRQGDEGARSGRSLRVHRSDNTTIARPA